MNYYLLFKSLHLITVISWMAGLLYLPRIFVYHVENYHKKEAADIFKTMEKKLYFYIMIPAMVLSWFLGLILFLIIGFSSLSLFWVKLKLIFIVLLTIYHFYLGNCLRKLKNDQNSKSSNFFRIINEIPAILLIIIIFIVIFKPV
tara:strand:- start:190 stop:624 length:435 start_codon:yes stop_codon:yes gene_type:complete